jgi:gluconolactonase
VAIPDRSGAGVPARSTCTDPAPFRPPRAFLTVRWFTFLVMRFDGQRFLSLAFVLAAAGVTASACSSSSPPNEGGSGKGGSSGGTTATGGATAGGKGGSGTGGTAAGAAGMKAGAGTGGTPSSGGSGGTGGGGTSGTGGSGTSGTTASGGASGHVGAGGTAGAATGGAGTGGSSGVPSAGTGGSAGGGAGAGAAGMAAGGSAGMGGSQGFTCPDPSTLTGSPIPSGATAMRITGAPPTDSFNMNNFTNVEGPVWIGDALYFSEMQNGNNPPPAARILKIDASNQVSVFIDDSGSNGLAVDNSGNLVAAEHGIGGIVSYDLATKMPTTLVSQYMGKRFNSPNDLTIKRDGTLFFSDPDFQNSARPQGATRAYQVPPGSMTPTVIAADYTSNPNGITLSIDEQTLFISGGMGVKQYAIDASGTVASSGTAFGTSLNMNTDGMVEDCAGNLYVAVVNSTNVAVVDRTGKPVANSPIQVTGPSAVTNVAFGGADHKTLYITGQGSSGQQGVFKVTLNFPGMPY